MLRVTLTSLQSARVFFFVLPLISCACGITGIDARHAWQYVYVIIVEQWHELAGRSAPRAHSVWQHDDSELA
jgi:hypothetical protein